MFGAKQEICLQALNKALTIGLRNDKKTKRKINIMGNRDAILAKLKNNKPELLPLPVIDTNVFDDKRNLVEEFTKKLEVVGGEVVQVKDQSGIKAFVNKTFSGSKIKYSGLKGLDDFNTIKLTEVKDPRTLDDLDVLVIESKLGVAENGAIWLQDDEIPVRVAPFITKHLVIVISEKDLVPFMHDAYKTIDSSALEFGIFISGPSKTADIEQSLVIGAHGALSLSVLLLG
jgi:L-lactate dehydrogenase complex protein LldG